jgi:acyl-CoA thioester hydrolase
VTIERGDEAFRLEFKVRDYECDLQGVVNNGVYMNYLEHARHEYLLEQGIDFAALAADGINLVVVRAELDYRSPLRSGDRFVVTLRVDRPSRLRFRFRQSIERLPDGRPVLQGVVTGTAVDSRGRPTLPPDLTNLLERDVDKG